MTKQPGQPAPLTEEQIARINENRAMVHQHAPEMLPMIKQLTEQGLIAGWRDVDSVEIIDNPNGITNP